MIKMSWSRLSSSKKSLWLGRVVVLVFLVTCGAGKFRDEKKRRGFLLTATSLPVDRLERQESREDDLGALLRDICATEYPVRAVVGTAREAAAVLTNRPCDRVEVVVLGGDGQEVGKKMLSLRLFKVGSIASQLPLYPDGTLYLDSDIALKRGAVGELFATFDDEMRSRDKAIGLVPAPDCQPRGHELQSVPKKFCERNSGAIFFGGDRHANASAAIAREWLAEITKQTSADGHDQMPLRKVLWRHREEVADLPDSLQCRSRRPDPGPCVNETLLWHWHHADRVDWAEKNAALDRI